MTTEEKEKQELSDAWDDIEVMGTGCGKTSRETSSARLRSTETVGVCKRRVDEAGREWEMSSVALLKARTAEAKAWEEYSTMRRAYEAGETPTSGDTWKDSMLPQ